MNTRSALLALVVPFLTGVAHAEAPATQASPVLVPVAARTSGTSPTATTTQVLQQRTADGRIVLTDRPMSGAKTERAWQFDAEDAAASRQRALDVKAEANIVSERIRRTIEQQRFADEEAFTRRLARADLERDRERARRADEEYAATSGALLFVPGAFFGRGAHGRRDHFDERRTPFRHPHRGGRMPSFGRFAGGGAPDGR